MKLQEHLAGHEPELRDLPIVAEKAGGVGYVGFVGYYQGGEVVFCEAATDGCNSFF